MHSAVQVGRSLKYRDMDMFWGFNYSAALPDELVLALLDGVPVSKVPTLLMFLICRIPKATHAFTTAWSS